MKFFPLFKLWARWFDGRRIFSVSRCVGISAARRDLPSAERHGSLSKAVGSADADADGLCAAAGACGGDSGDPAAAGGLPQKRSPRGNSGDLRSDPRDSITLSSLREPVLCVQRTLPLLCGGVLEPQEFPLPGVEGAERLLPGVGTRLLWTGSPYPL